MAFIDHIRRCNAHDPARFVRLCCGDVAIGFVDRHLSRRLLDLNGAFVLNPRSSGGGVMLDPDLTDADSRSNALEAALRQLDLPNVSAVQSGEAFSVSARFGDPPLFRVERAALSLLGLPAYGVHVNGLVRHPDGRVSMWIARRAETDHQFPGQLDQIVAGGLSDGYGAFDTLIKEACEEAGMPESLARTARPAGLVSYRMEMSGGLRNEAILCYDIDLSPDFEPVNTDGEVADFMLWPVKRVLESVRDGFDFKFNCSLVAIDYLIRAGYLAADSEPDFVDLVEGLRRTGPAARIHTGTCA